MTVEFIEPARLELLDAIEYYNYISPNFGEKLFDEITDTLKLIVRFPDIWSKCSKRTRKATLKKFPYNLIYYSDNEKVVVIAVAHQHRKPNYWMDRII